MNKKARQSADALLPCFFASNEFTVRQTIKDIWEIEILTTSKNMLLIAKRNGDG